MTARWNGFAVGGAVAEDGSFEIRGLRGGDYRFAARDPDMAKAAVKDVDVAVDAPTEGIEIVLTTGGAIAGVVTGRGKLPLANAMAYTWIGKYGAGTSAVSPGPIIARHMWLKPSLDPRQTITSSSVSSRTP